MFGLKGLVDMCIGSRNFTPWWDLDDLSTDTEYSHSFILYLLYKKGVDKPIILNGKSYVLDVDYFDLKRIKYLLDFDCADEDLSNQLQELSDNFGYMFHFARGGGENV